MRTENSLKNVFWSVFAFGVNLIVNFVARKIFIDILGAEISVQSVLEKGTTFSV